jgi:nucleotide-binding universal stress UspA family protein
MLEPFRSIVVGVDGSEESFNALEQALGLLAPDGRLLALTVSEERLAVHAGFDAARITDEIHAAAEAARARAAEMLLDLPGAEARLVQGRPTEALLASAEGAEADLVAVGSHEHGRAAAIVLGSVASEILHKAPQSVLVARRVDGDGFRRVVVGVDGSEASIGALAVGRRLAAGHEAGARVIAAEGGKPLATDELADLAEVERAEGHPVDTLVEAARDADLVVVGSRGLHGLASLGSVSERVCHRAACSVLVVRGTALARALDER